MIFSIFYLIILTSFMFISYFLNYELLIILYNLLLLMYVLLVNLNNPIHAYIYSHLIINYLDVEVINSSVNSLFILINLIFMDNYQFVFIYYCYSFILFSFIILFTQHLYILTYLYQYIYHLCLKLLSCYILNYIFIHHCICLYHYFCLYHYIC